ncbi:MAG: flagellar biosynthesis protein FlhB [Bryobacteraceae bacterium]
MASQDGKTEKPSLQRLKKAREQGQFLSAKGMITAVEFITALILISNFLPSWFSKLEGITIGLFRSAMYGDITDGQWIGVLSNLFRQSLVPVTYFGVALLAVVTAANLGITQFGFSLQKLVPQLNRLNPASRLKDMPGQNLKSVLEAIVLLGVLGVSITTIYRDNIAALMRLPFETPSVSAPKVADMISSLLWKAAGIFVLFGAVDFFRQYRKHMSSLKMSKEEIKQENKQNEGDPHIKGKIKRLRRDLLRRQMMREVPNATAVIVNPTHYAVAIKYDIDTMACPVVVAKGKNWLALRMRQIAVQNEVPIIENPPLARALYSAIDVGRAIPPEFYRAMAEILAYIYKLMDRRLPA